MYTIAREWIENTELVVMEIYGYIERDNNTPCRNLVTTTLTNWATGHSLSLVLHPSRLLFSYRLNVCSHST